MIWNKYQEAARLEVMRGRPRADPAPLKADLVKLYVKEDQSVLDVAVVHQALRKYGISTRSNASCPKVGKKSLLDRKPESWQRELVEWLGSWGPMKGQSAII